MKTLFCLLISMLLLSCNKERSIRIRAVNPVTGEAYSGLKFAIRQEKTSWDGEKVKTVASGTLNENGEIITQVKIKPNRTYSILCEQPENTCYNKQSKFWYAIQDEENPTFTFEFARCASLRIRVKNVNCSGEEDIFSYRDKYSYTGWTGWVNLYGCFDNGATEFTDVPVGKRYFNWKVTRGENTTEYVDSVEVKLNELTTFDLFY